MRESAREQFVWRDAVRLRYHLWPPEQRDEDKILHVLGLITPIVDFKMEKNPLAACNPAAVWWLHALRLVIFLFITLLGAALAGLFD